MPRAALAYFALVFGAGFAFGAVRVPLLAPRVGERAAELVEMPFMLLAIVLAARWIVRRFALAGHGRAAWQVGLLALALLLGAEVALAAALRGQGPAQALLERDPVAGGAYYAALCAYAAMPAWLATRRRAG